MNLKKKWSEIIFSLFFRETVGFCILVVIYGYYYLFKLSLDPSLDARYPVDDQPFYYFLLIISVAVAARIGNVVRENRRQSKEQSTQSPGKKKWREVIRDLFLKEYVGIYFLVALFGQCYYINLGLDPSLHALALLSYQQFSAIMTILLILSAIRIVVVFSENTWRGRKQI